MDGAGTRQLEPADDPEQLHLGHFLDHIVEIAGPFLAEDVPLALELTVGPPDNLPLTEHRDLDNYLKPVAKKLGHHRFSAVFGRKRHQDHSTLAIGPAHPTMPTRSPDLTVAPRGSYQRPEWRRQIRDACEQVHGLDPGGTAPIALTIAYDITPGRNWTELWKGTIDGLGPLLGTHPRSKKQDDDPQDGRITNLGLHQTINEGLGNAKGHGSRWDITVSFWWEAG